MKTIFNFRMFAMALVALLMFSCASTYPNTGTAHDRTGFNGATNGNGKAPRGDAHNFRY